MAGTGTERGVLTTRKPPWSHLHTSFHPAFCKHLQQELDPGSETQDGAERKMRPNSKVAQALPCLKKGCGHRALISQERTGMQVCEGGRLGGCQPALPGTCPGEQEGVTGLSASGACGDGRGPRPPAKGPAVNSLTLPSFGCYLSNVGVA